ncbi:MAG: DUF4845 domain-containing protein [Betaproteobacteria bacterium]
MKTKQTGVSLMALIIGLAVLVVVALFGMKVLPSYMEYRTTKATIEVIAKQPNASVSDIKKAFEARAIIDGITSVKPNDLDITKEGNEVVVGFSYRKEIPLFGNVGLYVDYAATSKE